MPRVVDALATIRSSRFNLPLTYDVGGFDVQVGDVVRVPLGNREVVGYIVSDVYDAPPDPKRKAVLERIDVPRAFDEEGLHLARFVAEYYICTLGEALSAAVLAGAIPRTIDSFVRTVTQPNPQRYPSVPARLVRLIWEELADGFALETLLRHPDARRAGDRSALLRHLQTLTRSGELRRERRFVQPKTSVYRIRVLFPGDAAIRGSKGLALAAFVREQPGVPRSDALLAGFSSAVIARAVKAGAIEERDVEPAHARSYAPLGDAPFPPTTEQAAALARVDAALDQRTFAELLLFGVTGSGKTYVYVEAIKRVVREGGRAIVLVPEISLTPQTARRFEESFGDRVAVLHSALSERERFDAWQACARGEIDVVVGARSAIFAPLPKVRLCVVDEAHETSYKQETVPRYHALTVARERMRAAGGVLVLGSATPPLESYEAALRGKVELVTLRTRATAQPMPHVHIVDLAKEFETGNKRIFSTALAQALGARIDRGEKTVLFVNRRGSGGFVLCRSCGHVPQCPRCDTSLTAHRSEGLLRCHYCDFQMPLPKLCPRVWARDDSRIRCRHRTRGGRSGAPLSRCACGAHGFRHHDAGGRSRAAAQRIWRTRRCAGGHADGRQRPRLSDRDAGRRRGGRRRLAYPGLSSGRADLRFGRTSVRSQRTCAGGRGDRADVFADASRRSCSQPRTTTTVSLAASLRSAENSSIRRFRAWSILALLGAAVRPQTTPRNATLRCCDRKCWRSPWPRAVSDRSCQQRMALSRGDQNAHAKTPACGDPREVVTVVARRSWDTHCNKRGPLASTRMERDHGARPVAP